jgi:hypothetical protein
VSYGVFVQFGNYALSLLFLLAGMVTFPPVLVFTANRLKPYCSFIEPVHLYACTTNAGLFSLIATGLIYSNVS